MSMKGTNFNLVTLLSLVHIIDALLLFSISIFSVLNIYEKACYVP